MPVALANLPSSFFLNISPSSFPPSPLCPPAQLRQTPVISLSLVKSLSTSLNSRFQRRRRWPKSICLGKVSPNDAVSATSELSDEHPNGRIRETGAEELELLDKPLPSAKPIEDGAVLEPHIPDKDEALAPFLKFLKRREGDDGGVESDEEDYQEEEKKREDVGEAEVKRVVDVEYYDPKPGDLVVGVVVYGNENKLDVNIGANLLGSMLTKEVLPFYDKELDYLLCDLNKDTERFMENGKTGLIQNEEALDHQAVPGRPVVEDGTVLFAQVLGRTLSGRPLLSSRRYFRRIAWHRVRQIKQLNEPIQIIITEWNTGGLLTRVEGLRAFLPKAELVTRINNFSELKDNVGRRMYVQISRTNEETNDLILSEREAWEKVYLREGTLLEGTVTKIFPYGAQVRIGETNRSGLLHMSNVTRRKVASVAELLEVDEKIKVLVLRSLVPHKISLSIAELESEPGLFITDKQRVFAEAEQMARNYKSKLPPVPPTRKSESAVPDSLHFEDEPNLYSNWAWFKFLKED